MVGDAPGFAAHCFNDVNVPVRTGILRVVGEPASIRRPLGLPANRFALVNGTGLEPSAFDTQTCPLPDRMEQNAILFASGEKAAMRSLAVDEISFFAPLPTSNCQMSSSSTTL